MELSPAVERALDAARRRTPDAELNAVYVLLALIADDEGRAAQVLVEAGGELEQIRHFLEAHPAVPFDLPDVLTGAREVAGERDETAITGEYLLLGLVRSSELLHEPLRRARVRVDELTQSAEVPPIAVGEPLEIPDPVEYVSAARVVDANANRAREALRVLDDYCRFVLNDAITTEEIKSLRHRLAELLARIPSAVLDESRDTSADIGTVIATAGEMVRGSPAEVARVNFKRLQEALRSLEEYGKLLSADLASGLEAIRYRAYTVEKAVSISGDARVQLQGVRLYVLLTGSTCAASLDWTIREAADGGVTMFQFREKTLSDRELLERARNVRRWTRDAGCLFIVNDRPDIARLAEADGVHLGQDDLSVAEARKILGPGPLIGISTHTADQVRQAVFDGASYIGVGPTFASSTKEFSTVAGLDFVRQATNLTTLPTFVIGGVNADNIGQAVVAGATRVAVSAAICQAVDPRVAAATLVRALTV
jgi:thiamine-phosphate pyrophosphorylase